MHYIGFYYTQQRDYRNHSKVLPVTSFSIKFPICVTVPLCLISNDNGVFIHISVRRCFDNSQVSGAPICFPVLIGIKQQLVRLNLATCGSKTHIYICLITNKMNPFTCYDYELLYY